MTVYHVSEDRSIGRFEPRMSSITETAGYYVSRAAVEPARVECVDDPAAAILQRGAELRILPNLWSLRNAVIDSTLEYSIIRWRNASPRTAA